MSEVATDECEGCGEERPVQQLSEVRLPGGQSVRCCPECRYHAERLAETTTGVCDGCGAEVVAAELDPTPLTDGRKLDLCPDCVAEASTMFEADRVGATGDADATAAADGPGGATPSTADPCDGSGPGVGVGAAVDGPSGRTSDRSTDATAGDAASADGGSTVDGDGASSDGTVDAGAAGGGASAADDGLTGKPATTDDVCDQCGELFSVELYKVETVDGRTEEFCPDCKDEGVDAGIVRDVELRRAQAYEVLELDGSADQDEIRQAYLRRVKEVHPDREEGNRSEFMLVQEAYERLSED